MNRETIAMILKGVKGNKVAKQVLMDTFKERGYFLQGIKDTSTRGQGNKAYRRMGETPRTSCDCVTCVVYGGDCYWQMWKEDHSAWHRAQRGVKTRRRG